MLIKFNYLDSATILFLLKKSRLHFYPKKILMFAKLSLIYDLVETFTFTDETNKEIYKK